MFLQDSTSDFLARVWDAADEVGGEMRMKWEVGLVHVW